MKILFKFLLVSLLLGIAYSCGDDKDNEDNGGEKPKVKLLPVKIIKNSFQEHTVTKDVTYTFKYNEENQITQIETNDGGLYTFYHNSNGILTKVIKGKYEYKISYDKEIVTINAPTELKDRPKQFKIDTNGKAIYFIEEEKDIYQNKREYIYDNNSNLISDENNRSHLSIAEKDKSVTTYDYSEFYSPYVHINLPPWILLGERFYGLYYEDLNILDLPFYNTIGKNMPKGLKVDYSRYENDKPVENNSGGKVYDDFAEVLIISSEENYPTHFKVVGENYDGDFSVTYTVIYKEIK